MKLHRTQIDSVSTGLYTIPFLKFHVRSAECTSFLFRVLGFEVAGSSLHIGSEALQFRGLVLYEVMV